MVHTVKGPLAGVRHSLKEWVLGNIQEVRAARDPAGPFELLRDLPEFRDLIFEPPPPACLVPATANTLQYSSAAACTTEADMVDPDPPAKHMRAGKLPEKKPALAPVIVHLDAGPKDSYKWVLLLIFAALSGIATTYYLIPFIRSLRLILLTRIFQAGQDVLRFEKRRRAGFRRGRHRHREVPGRRRRACASSTQARAAAALARFDRDALEEIGLIVHDSPLYRRSTLSSVSSLSRRKISSEITPSDEYSPSGCVWQSVSNSVTSSSANSFRSFGSDSERDLDDPSG